MFRAKTLQRHDERGPASGFRSEDRFGFLSKVPRRLANKLTRRCVPLPLQGKITAQGKPLQQDTFFVSEQENGILSRARERRVFLFEQLVIFSEPIDKKKGLPLPGYTFKNSIKVSVAAPVTPAGRSAVTPLLPVSCVLSGQLFGSGGAPRGASGLPGADLQSHRRQRGPLRHAGGVPANKAGLARRRGPDFRDSEELPQRCRGGGRKHAGLDISERRF